MLQALGREIKEGGSKMRVRQTLSKARHEAQLLAQRKRDAKTYKRVKDMTMGTVDELVDLHFQTWSDPVHVNRPGFEAALFGCKDEPMRILETGTSAWGTDSTRLWDSYVDTFGGEFWSVDLSAKPSRRLANQTCSRSHLIVSDSVTFIRESSHKYGVSNLDICYLDSWDLDWDDPTPAAIHGLAEWEAVLPILGKGAKVLVDDTPISLSWVPVDKRELAVRYLDANGFLPGKGALILRQISEQGLPFKILWGGYNVVLELED